MTTSSDELIVSGDGKTTQTPIKFLPCHLRTRIVRERLFITEQFGIENEDWQESLHYTSLDWQSVWEIKVSDGTHHSVYSDTSKTIYDEE